jgi:hypothetical protein
MRIKVFSGTCACFLLSVTVVNPGPGLAQQYNPVERARQICSQPGSVWIQCNDVVFDELAKHPNDLNTILGLGELWTAAYTLEYDGLRRVGRLETSTPDAKLIEEYVKSALHVDLLTDPVPTVGKEGLKKIAEQIARDYLPKMAAIAARVATPLSAAMDASRPSEVASDLDELNYKNDKIQVLLDKMLSPYLSTDWRSHYVEAIRNGYSQERDTLRADVRDVDAARQLLRGAEPLIQKAEQEQTKIHSELGSMPSAITAELEHNTQKNEIQAKSALDQARGLQVQAESKDEQARNLDLLFSAALAGASLSTEPSRATAAPLSAPQPSQVTSGSSFGDYQWVQIGNYLVGRPRPSEMLKAGTPVDQKSPSLPLKQ